MKINRVKFLFPKNVKVVSNIADSLEQSSIDGDSETVAVTTLIQKLNRSNRVKREQEREKNRVNYKEL